MDILFNAFSTFWNSLGLVANIFYHIWFLVLPPFLYYIFKELWMPHVWHRFGDKQTSVLLEIIPPRDIEASPLPMEYIYAGIAGIKSGPMVHEEYIDGDYGEGFSLEIASVEGQVHMYIRCRKKTRSLVEAHFYGQYPNVELIEVPDYTEAVPRSAPNQDWNVWGTDFELVKDDLYPIRTYRNFEETVTGKMIDPLAGIIEIMGKAGPMQHMWFQILVSFQDESWYSTGRATVDDFIGKKAPHKQSALGRLFTDIKDVIFNLIPALFASELHHTSSHAEEKKEFDEQKITYGQKEVIKALEENLGKMMFKVKMRYVYVGRREGFDKATAISGFIGGLKQFNDQNLNSFKPNNKTKTKAEFIFTESRLRYQQRRIFRRYIERNPEPSEVRFLMSTEELATVFHIPDMSVTAPALNRIVAKRGGAPSNLPM
jgi:hypothetical protein